MDGSTGLFILAVFFTTSGCGAVILIGGFIYLIASEKVVLFSTRPETRVLPPEEVLGSVVQVKSSKSGAYFRFT